MRKHLISILTLLLFLSPLFCIYGETENISVQEIKGRNIDDNKITDDYFSSVPDSDLLKLEKEGKLTLFLEKGQPPIYLPDVRERSELNEEINENSFNTGIETIFLHREKKYLKSIEEYFKILTNIKSLEGIQYYSHSRERYRLLFEEAYPVVGTSRKKPAETPLFNEKIRHYSFNSYIKDLSFGRNYYKMDYTVSDNYLIMKMTNIDDMRYGIIPVIDREDLTFYLIIMADGDELAVYCSGMCSHVNAGFLRKKIRNSIHSRVEALYEWFKDNASEGN